MHLVTKYYISDNGLDKHPTFFYVSKKTKSTDADRPIGATPRSKVGIANLFRAEVQQSECRPHYHRVHVVLAGDARAAAKFQTTDRRTGSGPGEPVDTTRILHPHYNTTDHPPSVRHCVLVTEIRTEPGCIRSIQIWLRRKGSPSFDRRKFQSLTC